MNCLVQELFACKLYSCSPTLQGQFRGLIAIPVCRHDLSAHSALLRMQHFYASTPSASDGNGAAHLTNYALHNVVERTKRMRDPRMRAIRQVVQLQSLWPGDIGNYKWGGRQPVRRRRGDVHGDMTTVVLHINWPGKDCAMPAHIGGMQPVTSHLL